MKENEIHSSRQNLGVAAWSTKRRVILLHLARAMTFMPLAIYVVNISMGHMYLGLHPPC